MSRPFTVETRGLEIFIESLPVGHIIHDRDNKRTVCAEFVGDTVHEYENRTELTRDLLRNAEKIFLTARNHYTRRTK